MRKDGCVFRTGWIIQDCARASGGVAYGRAKLRERRTNSGQGQQTEHKTKKTVDHVEFVADMDAMVKKVDYILRKHCVNTLLGWFADDDATAAVMAEVVQLKVEAAALNQRAAGHTARTASIDVVPLRLDLTLPAAVRILVSTLREILTAFHDALRAGQLSDLHKLRIRAINLDLLVCEPTSSKIRFALARAPQAAKEIRGAQRVALKAAKEAGKKKEDLDRIAALVAQQAGAQLDLSVIEAALAALQCCAAQPDTGSMESTGS